MQGRYMGDTRGMQGRYRGDSVPALDDVPRGLVAAERDQRALGSLVRLRVRVRARVRVRIEVRVGWHPLSVCHP